MNKCIELFAGAGGLALGLENSGFQSIGLVEIDKYACSTLKTNRPQWNVINKDIVELSEENLEEVFQVKSGELDLLSGGFPCQSFSYAGKQLGLDDVRGTMFYYYATFLKKLQPKMFLAENVRGLVTHDNGKTLQTILSVFGELGYNVTYKVLNSWDYDVAQKRQRIFLIGIRNDLKGSINFEFPTPSDYKPTLKDILKNVPPSIGSKYPESKRKVLELVPQGGCWVDLPEEVAKEYMKKSYYLGGGRRGMARRISWDEPSLTLTCSPAQKQTERCHPEETRPFNVREYARIQSFPDDWEFTGSMSNQYKQIGNAVPVKLAEHVGKKIYESLNGGKNMAWNLGFISRTDLKEHIKQTILEYGITLESIDLEKFNSNIIDPIKLTFDSKVYQKSLEEIIDDEIFRQRDKTNNNAIGYFHQNMFEYIANCVVPEEGWDVIFTKDDDTKLYVEMKNKHNTMNGASSRDTYIKMQNQLLEEDTCICALVEVIAKRSQDIQWEKKIDGIKCSNSRLRRISIDKFYTIVTGDNSAFKKLCDVLPVLIDEIIDENDNFTVEEDTVLNELRMYHPDLLKALYKLAFNTYESFEF